MMSKAVVDDLRPEHRDSHVAGFDPPNGNERARILLLLESPATRAVACGTISLDNDDQLM